MVSHRDVALRGMGLDGLSDADAASVTDLYEEILGTRIMAALEHGLPADQFAALLPVLRDMSTREAILELSAEADRIVAQEVRQLRAEIANAANRIVSECTTSGPTTGSAVEVDTVGDSVVSPTNIYIAHRFGATVVSPAGAVVVSTDSTCRELYAATASFPPVVLQLPNSHVVDPETLWCDDLGVVRCGFEDDSDLRWGLDSGAGSVIAWDVVPAVARPPLVDQLSQLPTSDVLISELGGFTVEDAHQMVVTDSASARSIELEPLFDGPHANAVQPHFTPDGTRLVGAHNVGTRALQRSDAHAGVAACSIEYVRDALSGKRSGGQFGSAGLEALDGSGSSTTADDGLPADEADEADDAGVQDAPVAWEHRVVPEPWPDSIKAVVERPPVGFILGVGHDTTSSRAAVLESTSVSTYDSRSWERMEWVVHPTMGAVTHRVELADRDVCHVEWVGRSLLLVGHTGSLWMLDLDEPDGRLHALDVDSVDPGGRQRTVVGLGHVGQEAHVVTSDGHVTRVDQYGKLAWADLNPAEPLVAATPLADGRILSATESSIQLRRDSEVESTVRTSELVRELAGCPTTGQWAFAVHQDGTMTTLRARGSQLTTAQSLPGSKLALDKVHVLSARMHDVNDWLLTCRAPPDALNDNENQLLSPEAWRVGPDPRCVARLPAIGYWAVGTPRGVEFVAGREPGRVPRKIPLEGEVRSIATGACSRSVAAVTDDSLWLCRLLT